jgi:hypothetical protein
MNCFKQFHLICIRKITKNNFGRYDRDRLKRLLGKDFKKTIAGYPSQTMEEVVLQPHFYRYSFVSELIATSS